MKHKSQIDRLAVFVRPSVVAMPKTAPSSDTHPHHHRLSPAAAKAMVQSIGKHAWLPSLLAIHGRAFPVVPIGLVTAWAVGVTVLGKGVYSDKIPQALDKFAITMAGTALFFLLVFRSNASYSRWWEGRQRWGMVINRTRDLTRQACHYVEPPAVKERVAKWMVAFAYCMMKHLRFQHEVGELSGVADAVRLSEGELSAILDSAHMPLFCLDVVAQALKAAHRAGEIDSITLQTLDANLTSLEDSLGACERILKTPFPWSYLVHLRTFMFVWLMAAPFCALSALGWATIPVVFFAAYGLMGIEQIGCEIENPFGTDPSDLNLAGLCKTIETNLAELLLRSKDDHATMGGLKWNLVPMGKTATTTRDVSE